AARGAPTRRLRRSEKKSDVRASAARDAGVTTRAIDVRDCSPNPLPAALRRTDLRVAGRFPQGQGNGMQANEQLVSPTSHCDSASASPMSQSPSWLTSQRCARVKGACPHVRSFASYCATSNASARFTTPSSFTSPQSPSSVVEVLDDVLLDVDVLELVLLEVLLDVEVLVDVLLDVVWLVDVVLEVEVLEEVLLDLL